MTTLAYGRPMRVIPFFSGGASSALAMYNDSNRGKLYEVVAGWTDWPDTERSEKGRNIIDNEFHVPLLGLTRREFYERSGLDPKDHAYRGRYYEEVARQIEDFEADVIAMCGYMDIITDPLLSKYVVLNVHPGDLTILAGSGNERIYMGNWERQKAEDFIREKNLHRKYTGSKTVPIIAALETGERYVLSTVHIATEEIDEGPIVTQSQAFSVDPDMNNGHLKQYAEEILQRMKIHCDGPAYLKALELLATTLEVTPDKKLILDGEELPYGGVQL